MSLIVGHSAGAGTRLEWGSGVTGSVSFKIFADDVSYLDLLPLHISWIHRISVHFVRLIHHAAQLGHLCLRPPCQSP